MKNLIFKSFLLLFFSMTWGLSYGQKNINVQLNETIKKVNHIRYIGTIDDSFQLKNYNQRSNDIIIIKRLDKIHHFKGINNMLIHSSDNKYFVCNSYDEGGYSNTFYFFDKNEALLNIYKFDGESRPSISPSFNFTNTYFYVAEENGNFYIFKPNGSLKLKSNTNQLSLKVFGEVLTFDISKDGELILMGINNNGLLILNKKLEVLKKFNVGIASSFISPKNNQIFLANFKYIEELEPKKFVVVRKITFPEQILLNTNKLIRKSSSTKKNMTYELE